MKRIKVFLGGYVNYLNAQNINCRALSEHLDRKRFKVATLLYPVQNATDFVRLDDVKYIQQFRPMKWLMWLGYLRGILWGDVAYLPKGEVDGFCRTVAKLSRTKVFTTIEGLIGETDLSKIPEGHRKAYLRHFAYYEPNLFAITRFLIKDVGNRRGYRISSRVLYLGVESKKFLNPHKDAKELRNIVFIGNKLPTKNIFDFMEISKIYKDINFHIIGDDQLGDCTIQEYIKEHSLKNITFHGRLDHKKMSIALKNMDLMYFPSRSEGFPKVMLETACAGVPTLCYNDYGADEWITTSKDGYVVQTKEEAIRIISDLKAHPEKLQQLSRNAVELGKRFDWSVLVKQWENVIQTIYNE